MNKIRINTEENSEILEALNQWKELHGRILFQWINETNYDRIFSEIYVFRSIIVLIDQAIEQVQITPTEKQNIQVSTPYGELDIALKVGKTKPIKLLSQWEKFDEVDLSFGQGKEMEITFLDVLRLRYANYVGFIQTILDFASLGYLVYEVYDNNQNN